MKKDLATPIIYVCIIDIKFLIAQNKKSIKHINPWPPFTAI